MKRIHYALPIIVALLLLIGGEIKMNFAAEGNKNILVAYFSHSGNTRKIANQIHRLTGGDIFEIQSTKPYPKDYDTVVAQASQELKSGLKPALKKKINNIRSYDVIIIGYPNWWGTFPAPVKTFFSENDLSGKSIAPFCTHEGSGLGNSVSDISKLCPKAAMLEGIAIRGSSVKSAQNKVSDWLRQIKITK